MESTSLAGVRLKAPEAVAPIGRLNPFLLMAMLGVPLLLSACAPMQPSPETSLPPVPPQLVHITEGGEFTEVRRTPEYSIVEVPQAPAGAVASSLFALRGSCAVARARGEEYFASSIEPAGVRTYRLTFPKAPTSAQLSGQAKSVFSRADCHQLRF